MSQAATIIGRDTDLVFYIVTGICALLLFLILFFLLYFAFRYSRQRNPHSTDVEGNPTLELSFLGGSLAIVLVMFVLGWDGYRALKSAPPANALEVKAKGQMWVWTFEYPNGAQHNQLVLPAGEPVKMSMTSLDVIHSFYVPAFRVKQDALPGVERTIWFVPDTTGTYDLFCAEYCGTGHSAMITKAVVVSGADFTAWLKGEKEISPAAAPAAKEAGAPKGEELYKSKGCSACHTIDGGKSIGPTFKGLFGSKVKVATGGKVREVVVDEQYIRRSELEPNADIVEGYQPVMPPQKGVLKEEEIEALIEFIRRLK